MIKLVNLKSIKTATVNADGTLTVNPVVETSAIVKSPDTAKRIACENLGFDKMTTAATVVIGIEKREQHFFIDDAIFFEYATPCEPPRKGKGEEEETEEE